MPIKTLDLAALAAQTGNLYEAVVVLSKRARQISANTKAELDEKLSYFEGFETEVEDARMNDEQKKISLEYELRPKATESSINEMMQGEVYFRNPYTEE